MYHKKSVEDMHTDIVGVLVSQDCQPDVNPLLACVVL